MTTVILVGLVVAVLSLAAWGTFTGVLYLVVDHRPTVFRAAAALGLLLGYATLLVVFLGH